MLVLGVLGKARYRAKPLTADMRVDNVGRHERGKTFQPKTRKLAERVTEFPRLDTTVRLGKVPAFEGTGVFDADERGAAGKALAEEISGEQALVVSN